MNVVSQDEFSLIFEYFQKPGLTARQINDDVIHGIGDDCAVLRTHDEEHLVLTTDTLIEGRHFPVGADAKEIGQRSLRVNLSDLAAMGAEPRCFQLALSLPKADPRWLKAFSQGLYAVAREFSCMLVGGDTTRGPLTISITAIGAVPSGSAVVRSGGTEGDKIFVTGTLGSAIAGLHTLQAEDRVAVLALDDCLRQAFWRPQPRLKEGRLLRKVASAMIDVSDGLLADLGHIAKASGLGAEIYLSQLPIATRVLEKFGEEQARQWALSGGDDYELCFAVPENKLKALNTLQQTNSLCITEIGKLLPGSGVHCLDSTGQDVLVKHPGYRHF